MRVKCYSVRLKSLVRISDKAFNATCFDGTSDVIPASQVFSPDLDVYNSDAWWISEWILERKELQYSRKKMSWFDSESRQQLPTIMVERHQPEKRKAVACNSINELKR